MSLDEDTGLAHDAPLENREPVEGASEGSKRSRFALGVVQSFAGWLASSFVRMGVLIQVCFKRAMAVLIASNVTLGCLPGSHFS